MQKKMRIGDLLVSVGKITQEQLMQALKEQKTLGKKLGEVLVKNNYITENELIEVLEFQLGIPHVNLDEYVIEFDVINLIPENLARKYTLIPMKKDTNRNKLQVAMADPLDIFAIDDIKMATGIEIEPVISTKKEIQEAIEQYYGKQNAEKAVEEFKKQYSVEDIEGVDEEVLKDINNAPVVRLVNSILKQAVKSRASDIHIEPYERTLRVRFRLDGVLQEAMSPSKSTHSAIVTRIKIMGNMDIAEKRIPQDGRIELKIEGRQVDLRVSVLPTVFGEKIVIRLMDTNSFMMTKKQLGFTHNNLDRFDNLLKNSNGIILVTGPTGSGKSTTMYTALREINDISDNIVTIEDPVEFKMKGINQVQVNTKAGMTFASGLRAILRQDPDIIMIGEIRDVETAQIAIRAAITGHLVISTMHTNSAAETVTRLLDMGIKPYLISSSVVGVLAQRLLRRICKECKEEYTPDDTERSILGISNDRKLHRGKGCSKCNYTGYKGRIAIHEIMPITHRIKELIDSSASVSKIEKSAIEEGMETLRENSINLVLSGITTVDELIRVTYTT